MKIVHIQHPFIPNKGYQENHLPIQQAELGHEVWLLTSNVVPSKFGDVSLEHQNPNPNLKIIRYDPWFYMSEIEDGPLKNITGTISEINPDIIHSHGLVSPRLLQAIITKIGTSNTKLVVDVHIDNDNFHLDSWFKKSGFWVFKNVAWKVINARIDQILPVNPYAKKFVEDNFDFSLEKIELLPLGVDTSEFYPDENERHAFRRDLDIPENESVILFVGNIEPTKDIDILIKSFELLNNDYSNTTLLIVGSGEDDYLEELQNQADNTNCTSKILFVGEVPHNQLRTYYNAADFGVWPGKLGVAIIEAIGTGLPVIISKNEATGFYIKEDNGLSFERGDSEILLQMMTKYINSPSLLNNHSKNAKIFADNQLKWEEIATKSIEIYNNL